ncbi:MAG TPA: DUF1684 domain-containing protein [Lacisediminihabitans sp.]|uniref:DUF1684 domain-containing protein n=1 Tax=Lacisediminihabitans sp. TaxID=2787631 RepID=UPI002ED93B06
MTASPATQIIAPSPGTATAFERDWVHWHDRHEADRADRHGFLAVTGIHWLDAAPLRFADVPGAWSTSDAGPVVELDGGEHLELDGLRVTGRVGFGPIPERGGRTASFGEAVVEVARRGGHDIVRPRHPDHPLRTAYRGTPAFAPDPRWRLSGRFVPFETPQETTVGSVAEGLQHVYAAPGAVEFELDGETRRLIVFPGFGRGSLLALFTDATGGISTYAANRSLSIEAPDEHGAVTIDFNRATNLPCAYTDFATCPLPPAGNHLPVAVEAGERIPLERGGAA